MIRFVQEIVLFHHTLKLIDLLELNSKRKQQNITFIKRRNVRLVKMNQQFQGRQTQGIIPVDTDQIQSNSTQFSAISFESETLDQSQQENQQSTTLTNPIFEYMMPDHGPKKTQLQGRILMQKMEKTQLNWSNVTQQNDFDQNENYLESNFSQHQLLKETIEEEEDYTQNPHGEGLNSRQYCNSTKFIDSAMEKQVFQKEQEGYSMNNNQLRNEPVYQQLEGNMEVENDKEVIEEDTQRNQTMVVSLRPQFVQEPCDSKKFCIFSECIVDLNLLDPRSDIYNLSTSQSMFDFKKTSMVMNLNNSDVIFVLQDSPNPPLMNFAFLLDMLKSLGTDAAYHWYQVIELFQRKTKPQIDFITKMMQQPQAQLSSLKEYFQNRRRFSDEVAQKRIKQLQRNQYATYLQYNFDFDCKSFQQSGAGYSRKILDIIGIPFKDAPSIFLRKGPLELTSKLKRAWDMIYCTIQMVDHPKKGIIDDIRGETIIQTLDMIKLEAQIRIRLYNLSNRFDEQNQVQFPFQDDTLVEIIYEISESNLEKFQMLRKQKNIFNKFSIFDILDGEFQYHMDVENFLTKYYNSSISSSSKSLKKKAIAPQNMLDSKSNPNDVHLNDSSKFMGTPNSMSYNNNLNISTSFVVSNSSVIQNLGEQFMHLLQKDPNQINQSLHHS